MILEQVVLRLVISAFYRSFELKISLSSTFLSDLGCCHWCLSLCPPPSSLQLGHRCFHLNGLLNTVDSRGSSCLVELAPSDCDATTIHCYEEEIVSANTKGKKIEWEQVSD